MDYNKMRMEFMEKLNPSIQRAYKLLFAKIEYYEKRTGIIFEEMNEMEFQMFTIKELIDNSSASANVKVCLLKKYINSIGKDFIKLTRDDMIKLTESKLGNKETDENDLRYISWEELKKVSKNIINPIDKAIVYLIRMGVCGTRFNDIINLKTKDIDLENEIIHLQDRDVRIVDKDVLMALREAIEQKTYIVMLHKEDSQVKATEFNFNMECEYLIKQRPIAKNNNGLNAYKFAGMTGRVYRIFEDLGIGVSSINLLQSNAVDRLIEYEDEIGESLSMSNTKIYLKSIGINQYHYDIKHLSMYVRQKYGR